MKSCFSIFHLAQWLSWLERRPVTAEVTGSSPVWVVSMQSCLRLIFPYKFVSALDAVKRGILAQLGEHLPYKQRVIGSSPIGPTYLSRSGGTGRRTGLKILRG